MSAATQLSVGLSLNSASFTAGAARAGEAARKLRDDCEGAGVGFGKLAAAFATGNLAAGAIKAVASAVANFVPSSVMLASQFETTELSFKALLGSADKAKSLFADLKQFGSATPFTLQETSKAATTLLNYGVAAEDIISTLTTLGDASQGNAEKLGAISTAFGQIIAKGKASQEELNQFAEAGVAAQKILADKLFGGDGTKLADALQKGVVTADKAISALLSGMKERYGGFMDDASKTVGGLASSLADVGDGASAAFGKGFTDASGLKAAMSDMASMQQHAEGLGQSLGYLAGVAVSPLMKLAALTKAAADGVSQLYTAVLPGASTGGGLEKPIIAGAEAMRRLQAESKAAAEDLRKVNASAKSLGDELRNSIRDIGLDDVQKKIQKLFEEGADPKELDKLDALRKGLAGRQNMVEGRKVFDEQIRQMQAEAQNVGIDPERLKFRQQANKFGWDEGQERELVAAFERMEGAKLRLDNASPLQRYNRELERMRQLLRAGAIDQETFDRAKNQALGNLEAGLSEKQQQPFSPTAGAAALKGSREAYSIIANASGGAGQIVSELKLMTRQQREENQTAKQILEEAKKANAAGADAVAEVL